MQPVLVSGIRKSPKRYSAGATGTPDNVARDRDSMEMSIVIVEHA